MKLIQETGILRPQFEEIVRNALDRRVFADVTTPGADVEFSIEHGLGFIPIGYLVISQDKAASTYQSSTAWSNSHIFLKTNVSAVALRVMVF